MRYVIMEPWHGELNLIQLVNLDRKKTINYIIIKKMLSQKSEKMSLLNLRKRCSKTLRIILIYPVKYSLHDMKHHILAVN